MAIFWVVASEFLLVEMTAERMADRTEKLEVVWSGCQKVVDSVAMKETSVVVHSVEWSVASSVEMKVGE